MQGSRTRVADGVHLYLDIAKSGFLFHGHSGGMRTVIIIVVVMIFCIVMFTLITSLNYLFFIFQAVTIKNSLVLRKHHMCI